MADDDFAMPLAPMRAPGAVPRPSGAIAATPMTNKDFRQVTINLDALNCQRFWLSAIVPTLS